MNSTDADNIGEHVKNKHTDNKSVQQRSKRSSTNRT